VIRAERLGDRDELDGVGRSMPTRGRRRNATADRGEIAADVVLRGRS